MHFWSVHTKQWAKHGMAWPADDEEIPQKTVIYTTQLHFPSVKMKKSMKTKTNITKSRTTITITWPHLTWPGICPCPPTCGHCLWSFPQRDPTHSPGRAGELACPLEGPAILRHAGYISLGLQLYVCCKRSFVSISLFFCFQFYVWEEVWVCVRTKLQ